MYTWYYVLFVSYFLNDRYFKNARPMHSNLSNHSSELYGVYFCQIYPELDLPTDVSGRCVYLIDSDS